MSVAGAYILDVYCEEHLNERRRPRSMFYGPNRTEAVGFATRAGWKITRTVALCPKCAKQSKGPTTA